MLEGEKGENKWGNGFVAGLVLTAVVQECFIVTTRKPSSRAVAAFRWDLWGSGTVSSTFLTDDLLSFLFFCGLYCGTILPIDVDLWYVK